MQSDNWVELLENFSDAALERRGQEYKHFVEMTYAEQKQLVMLRKNLLKEEAEEADSAMLDVYDDVGNEAYREHLLKELCDVLYVCIGAAVDLGLNIEAAFKAVHDNNMLKISNCTVREDGKLIKDKDHPTVDLNAFI